MFQLGEKVKIRDRLWTVIGLRQHESALTLRVKGIEEDNRGIERKFHDSGVSISLTVLNNENLMERLNNVHLKWFAQHLKHLQEVVGVDR